LSAFAEFLYSDFYILIIASEKLVLHYNLKNESSWPWLTVLSVTARNLQVKIK